MSKFKMTFFIPCVLFTVVLAAFVVTGCNGTTTIEDYVETGGAAAYDPAQPVKISKLYAHTRRCGTTVSYQRKQLW